MKIKGLLTKSNLLILAVLLVSLAALYILLANPLSKTNVYDKSNDTLELSLSHESGIYKKPFTLSVSTSDLNLAQRYSTDGSEPTEASPLYEKEILVDKTSVFRIALFENSERKSDIVTKVYIFSDHQFPVVSLVTNPSNLWDPNTGIYVRGNDPKKPNFTKKGDEWQKPAILSYLDTEGNLDIDMPVEIRVSGGATRYHPQKTLRVCAKNEYGYKSIAYDFFNSPTNKQHKCILLRNSGNDWDRTLFRDILGQSLIFETDVDTQYFMPAVVYINGEYWGIHNVREFYDDQYLKYKYGTTKESVVIVEPDRRKNGTPIVRDGKLEDGNSYTNLLNNVNDYEYLARNIDLANYIDYFLINIYTANEDWPDNNIRVWRFTDDGFSDFSIQPLDGKWRWLLFDLDSSFGLFKSSSYTYDTLNYATRSSILNSVVNKHERWPTAIIHTLLTNNHFKNFFINRYADLLNTNFSEEKVTSTINYLQSTYEPEIPMHINRWGGELDKGGKPAFDSVDKWHQNINVLREFALNRPTYAREHVIKKFKLSGLSKIILHSNEIEGGYIKINTIDTKNNITKNELIYFNDIPITLKSYPNFGWKFSGWGNEELSSNRSQEITLSKDIYLNPTFTLTWWGKLLNSI